VSGVPYRWPRVPAARHVLAGYGLVAGVVVAAVAEPAAAMSEYETVFDEEGSPVFLERFVGDRPVGPWSYGVGLPLRTIHEFELISTDDNHRSVQ
jgi:hypothetical protein